MKCLSQLDYIAKTSCDDISVNMRKKNAQISESDFGKPQNWKTSPYHSNIKFQGLFVNKFKFDSN